MGQDRQYMAIDLKNRKDSWWSFQLHKARQDIRNRDSQFQFGDVFAIWLYQFDLVWEAQSSLLCDSNQQLGGSLIQNDYLHSVGIGILQSLEDIHKNQKNMI